jgi:hypothetical protein
LILFKQILIALVLGKVIVQNPLADCLTVEQKGISMNSNLVTLEIAIALKSRPVNRVSLPVGGAGRSTLWARDLADELRPTKNSAEVPRIGRNTRSMSLGYTRKKSKNKPCNGFPIALHF